jgi:acyl carrier protein
MLDFSSGRLDTRRSQEILRLRPTSRRGEEGTRVRDLDLIEMEGGTTLEDRLVGRIREVIAAQLGLELGKVTRDAMLADDFGVDPLDLLELTLRLETSFEIQIPDNALARVRTVGDVERFVLKKVNATAF